jgi:hypothetical protein
MLVDEEETIARVKNERWRLSRKPQDEKESDEKNAVMCEEARDRVLEWCAQHNPRSTMETWTAEKANAKAVTELLQTTMGDTDFVCTREMWQAAIRVRDDLLVPLAQKLGAERGHHIWTTCIQGVQEITLCFQGIQATSRHQALALLKDAEVCATDGEWERAICTIRRRRGARPPLAAVTVKVQPTASLHRLLIDQQRVKQDKVEVWVCRDEEQLGSVTTLVLDPVVGGHCLRSWNKVYDMLGIPEALQRELILLAVMLEQPSFVPLDMLVGKLENPCVLAEVWKAKGVGSGPIHIAGNHTLVTPGNRYAVNEGCSIAGTEIYEGRRELGNHACLHRGAKSGIPKNARAGGYSRMECNQEKMEAKTGGHVT